MRRAIIDETTDGWEYAGIIYNTAIEALHAVQLESKRITEVTGETDMVLVEWNPTTVLGRMIVKAIV